MKKASNGFPEFILGKFRDTLLKRLTSKMKQEETNIQGTVKNINSMSINTAYSQSQKEDSIESYRKSLRRLEDRKASFYKRIQSLKKIEPKNFETLLKKNPKYDGFFLDESGNLNLYTKMLKDGLRNIGRFRLCIMPDQGSGLNFMAVNLDYTYNSSYDHWAISSNRCCLGEWQPDFERFLESGNIPEFFELFVLYITLSPENNTYCKKKEWYAERTKKTANQSDKQRTITLHDDEDYESDEEYEPMEDEGDDV